LVKTFKTWYKERVKEKTEPSAPTPASMVDPEVGRPPGGFEAPAKPIIPSDYHLKQEVLSKSGPIRSSSGKIIKQKAFAEAYMEQLGIKGKLVKDGEGWRVRKSKAERERFEKELREDYERQLREEGLEEIEPGSTQKALDIYDIISNERGEIKLDGKAVKEGIERLLKTGLYTPEDIARGLRAKGVSEQQIREIFQKSYVQKMNKGEQGESKFFKKGDDPNELLERRSLGKGRFAPAPSRIQAHSMATAKDIAPRLVNETSSWESGLKTFERITEASKSQVIEDSFYWRIKKADKAISLEHKQHVRLSREMEKKLSGKQKRLLGMFSNANQPGGEFLLADYGLPADFLSTFPRQHPKLMEHYNRLQAEYKEFYGRVNQARENAGQTKFPAVKNYASWFNDMDWLRREHGIGMLDDYKSIQTKLKDRNRDLQHRHAMFRKKDMPRKLELNPFKVYRMYTRNALTTIHKAEPLALMKELLRSKYGLYEAAPHTYSFLSQWRDTQVGGIHPWSIMHPNAYKVAMTARNNVVSGILSFATRSAIIQPTALVNTFTEVGWHTIPGILKATPRELKRAYRESDVLETRSFDVSAYESTQKSGVLGKLGEAQRKANVVGLYPLEKLDQLAAGITWLAAESKAKAKGIENPKQYADRITIKTQASGALPDRAPIQRHVLGQLLTSLQTFVMNNWGWLTRDVIGVGKLNRNNPEHVAKIVRYMVATAMVNYVYEELIGINSPLGTPVKSAMEVKENGGSDIQAAVAAATELLEYVPIAGGTIKYGSELGGPVISTLRNIQKYGEQLINTENPTEEQHARFYAEVAKLAGLPGANQLSKSYRAYKRDGTMMDMVLGRYVEKTKSSSGSGRGRARSRSRAR
jgi:SOS response regulatory protein OraA/RecX